MSEQEKKDFSVSTREEQEELVNSLMISPAVKIGNVEMCITMHKGQAGITLKNVESGVHYALTFPSQDLDVLPNMSLPLNDILKFVRIAAQVGILAAEIASGEKAERVGYFDPE